MWNSFYILPVPFPLTRITHPGPPPLGRAHFPTSPPAEISAREFGVYTRLGFNGMSGDDVANAADYP